MAHIEDRWYTGKGKARTKTARHGQGKRWRAIWVEYDGTRRSTSTASKDSAQAILDKVTTQVLTGDYITADKGRMKVKELWPKYVASQLHHRPQTVATIQNSWTTHINRLVGHMRMGDIDSEVIQEFITELSRVLAPNSVRQNYIYLRSFLNWAQDRGYCRAPKRVPSFPEVSAERYVPLKDGEVLAIREHIRPEFASMVLFGAATGLRPGELRGLWWEDLREIGDRILVTVRRQTDQAGQIAPLKTKWSYREFSIGLKVFAALGEPGKGFIWGSARSGQWSAGAQGAAWREARKLAGVDSSGWHDLRHYHASKLIAAGMSPVAVASRLGHKDASRTLDVYGHLWPTDDERMRIIGDDLITSLEHPIK